LLIKSLRTSWPWTQFFREFILLVVFNWG
jgi:hypothetical protein